jgi:hypothetical protein
MKIANLLYSILFPPVSLFFQHISLSYLKKGTIFGKKNLNTKYVV